MKSSRFPPGKLPKFGRSLINKFPRIEWDRKASPIAVIALIVAVAQVGVQLYFSFARPKIEVIPPDEVSFVADFSPADLKRRRDIGQKISFEALWAKAVVKLDYYHAGGSNGNAVLIRQFANVKIPSGTLHWVATEWGRQPQQNATFEWTFAQKEELPIVLRPHEAARCEVLFEAKPIMGEDFTSIKNFIGWEQFLKALDKAKALEVTIDSEFANHQHVYTNLDLKLRGKYSDLAPRISRCLFSVAGSATEHQLLDEHQ